jgi:thiol-disulfide isomerase/thioredoxin
MIALFWPRTDDVAPDGNLLDEMSQEVPLRPSQTRVTLVHLWATWCPPCIDEIPALQRLQRDYGEREDMRIVFIAVDDSPEKVKPFLGSIGTPVLYDPSWKLAHRYGTRKLPETHLVVDGRVVETFEGAANWDDPAIRRLLDKALAGPSL